MIFISPHRRFIQGCLPQTDKYHPATGKFLGVEPGVIAEFWAGGCPEWAKEIAVKAFQFRGLGDQEDPATRISYYDTDEQARLCGWDDEKKAAVEEKLLRFVGPECMRVDHLVPKLPKPWPSVDKALKVQGRRTVDVAVKEIVETAAQIGVELTDVVAYAAQENASQALLDALAEAEPQTGEKPELVEA